MQVSLAPFPDEAKHGRVGTEQPTISATELQVTLTAAVATKTGIAILSKSSYPFSKALSFFKSFGRFVPLDQRGSHGTFKGFVRRDLATTLFVDPTAIAPCMWKAHAAPCVAWCDAMHGADGRAGASDCICVP